MENARIRAFFGVRKVPQSKTVELLDESHSGANFRSSSHPNSG